jgi:hypothetical protein
MSLLVKSLICENTHTQKYRVCQSNLSDPDYMVSEATLNFTIRLSIQTVARRWQVLHKKTARQKTAVSYDGPCLAYM